MHDDDPADVVHDAVRRGRCSATTRSAGRSLGTVETIEAIGRGGHRRLLPAALPAAGHGRRGRRQPRPRRRRAARCSKAFGAAGSPDGAVPAPAAPRRGRRRRPAGGVRVVRRTTEQANVVLGGPGWPRTDERRFALGVLNAALGGGMSSAGCSRRSGRSAGWPTRSTPTTSQYADTGLFGVYAGCAPGKVDEVLRDLPRGARAGRRRAGITDEELERGKGQLRGSLVLGLEDTGSRMSRLGKAELRLRRAALRRRGARPDRRASPSTTSARSPPTCSPATPTLAVVGPFDEDRDFCRGRWHEPRQGRRARRGRPDGLEGVRAPSRPPTTSSWWRRLDVGDPLTALTDAGADVAVDFTQPDAVMDNLQFCIEHGVHAVVGTTGFDDERLATLRGWLADAPGVGVARRPQLRASARC